MSNALLIVGEHLEPIISRLPPGITTHCFWKEENPDAFLAKTGPKFRIIATDAFTGASAELMAGLPNLEVIVNFGVGYDTVDTDYAKAHGITITNTPDVLNDDVADLAIGLMLAVCRRICVADRFVRDGLWREKNLFPLSTKMSGKHLGILGLGRIGMAVARRAEAFDMPISYHNRHRRSDVDYQYFDSPVTLAEAVDVLVVLVPETAETRGMVDAAVMQSLGPDGVLINIARGPIVDEPALVKALQDGTLGGAGLDVFADEPHVPEELFAMENVVMQPHVGSATHDTRLAMAALVLQNIAAYFSGQPLVTPVEL